MLFISDPSNWFFLCIKSDLISVALLIKSFIYIQTHTYIHTTYVRIWNCIGEIRRKKKTFFFGNKKLICCHHCIVISRVFEKVRQRNVHIIDKKRKGIGESHNMIQLSIAKNTCQFYIFFCLILIVIWLILIFT